MDILIGMNIETFVASHTIANCNANYKISLVKGVSTELLLQYLNVVTMLSRYS